MDDLRPGNDIIKRGVRYDEGERELVFKDEWKEDDDMKDKTDLKRMFEMCLEVTKSIEDDLTVTVESEEDFENGCLQTLDFELWLDVQEGVVKQSFLEKR